MGLATNWFAAALLAASILFYVFVYTVWLKRRTPQNIVIGGAAGAFPPLIGWAAATGELGLPAAAAVRLIFLWTPPHFWALSLFVRDRLRQRRRADAAGGGGRGARPAADPALHAGAAAGGGWCPGRSAWPAGSTAPSRRRSASPSCRPRRAVWRAPTTEPAGSRPGACSASRCSISPRCSPLPARSCPGCWSDERDGRQPPRHRGAPPPARQELAWHGAGARRLGVLLFALTIVRIGAHRWRRERRQERPNWPRPWARRGRRHAGARLCRVPLYDMFCQVTGFGGTPQARRRAAVPGATGAHGQRALRRQRRCQPAVALRAGRARGQGELGEERNMATTARQRLAPPDRRHRDLQRHAPRPRAVVQQDPVLLLHRAVAEPGQSRSNAGGLLRRPGDGQGSALRQHQHHHPLRTPSSRPRRSGRRPSAAMRPTPPERVDLNMADGTPKHPYHLVDPSPWPALGATRRWLLAFGAGWACIPRCWAPAASVVKAVQWWIIAPGLVLILTMFWWWSDVIVERARSPHGGGPARPALRHDPVHRLGGAVLRRLLLGLLRRGAVPVARDAGARRGVGGVWPPKGISVIEPFDLPFMNTLILLLSGTTVTWAHHAILEGDNARA